MNIKKTLFAAVLSALCLSASAQNEPKTEYVFQPHWYVQAQIGGQYTLGEVDFGDLVSPTAQVALGYNFNKVLGARLAINAWQSKGGSDIYNTEYKWKWNYVAPAVDITANLSNLFCGYNPKRVVNFGVFAGIGANIAFSNDEAADANSAMLAAHALPAAGSVEESQYLRLLWDGTKARLLGQFGANVDFRLSDKVSLGVEASATTLGDGYNSKKAGNTDWYYNAMVGVKVNLGKTYTTRTIEAPAPQVIEKIVEKIVEKPVPTPAPAVEQKVEKIRRDIYFSICASDITGQEDQKVQDIVNYMKKYPNSRCTVTGYADKGTGNAKLNMGYSQKRANKVADTLRNKYGIAADRITVSAKGDTEQPYAENDLNRVTICIAE